MSGQPSEALEMEIKALIIEALDLEDISPNEIDSTEALFGEGLGLDSIDALELGVALEQKFSVRINAKDENIQEYFANVRNLARFVEANRAG